jgi:probable rRNA maturation factor
MHYTIHFVQEIEAQGLKTPMKEAALETLVYEEAVPGSLTLVLTDEEKILRMNQEYAGIDHSTDVLAFPGAELDPDEDAFYFGDIIIALPVAQRQAEKAGHAVQAEVALLAVHGTLHLLGYDHGTQAEKDTMWAKQAAILKTLGLESIKAGG